MKDLLIETLNVFNYPIYQQGSMAEEEPYPDHFFTFWNNDSYDDGFYDNKKHRTIWNFELNFYSIDPMLVNEIFIKVKELLKEKKFFIDGNGHDVVSDEKTHTGRGINVLALEK